MEYTKVLGKKIKSEFLIDLFETYDVDVIYMYDRTYEGIEDEYHASIPDMGLEFLFNKEQSLIALFMQKSEHSGHNPFTGSDPRNTDFNTAKGAIDFAKKHDVDFQHQEEQKHSIFGVIPEWVKFNFSNYIIHYQFSEAGVSKVTLQLQNA